MRFTLTRLELETSVAMSHDLRNEYNKKFLNSMAHDDWFGARFWLTLQESAWAREIQDGFELYFRFTRHDQFQHAENI